MKFRSNQNFIEELENETISFFETVLSFVFLFFIEIPFTWVFGDEASQKIKTPFFVKALYALTIDIALFFGLALYYHW